MTVLASLAKKHLTCLSHDEGELIRTQWRLSDNNDFFTGIQTTKKSYQYAVNVISIQVSSRSLQQPPVAAFIVGDVGLDLVVLPLVSNQHAFNSCHLMDTDT